MPSAKQQSSNIKHGGGIRPKVCRTEIGTTVLNKLIIYNILYTYNIPIAVFELEH